MPDDEDETKDWELEEEIPPEPLKHKWEKGGPSTVRCPACKNWIPQESLTCLFCGSTIYHDTGLLGKFLRWLKGF